MTQSFNLDRFISAQEPVYPQVVHELNAGKKQSHWMWFIFPQLAGLGRSKNSQFYAIESIEEAKAYLAHPVLGARLKECTQLLMHCTETNATRILGSPDDMKFRSCMTLFFEICDEKDSVFKKALNYFFLGQKDLKTIELLGF